MLKVLGWAIIVIIGLPVAWLGSAFVYETWHTYFFRYRLTIEVEVDGKVYVGSGVRQASFARKATWIPQSRGASRNARGEAIVIDLERHGKLFALMKGITFRGDAESIVLNAFPAATGVVILSSENMRRFTKAGLRSELTLSQYPMFVRFRDLNNPLSIELFDVAKSWALSTGEPKIRRVTIETTRDTVTSGLSKTLVWFDDWQKRGGAISRQVIFRPPISPEALLTPRDFAN